MRMVFLSVAIGPDGKIHLGLGNSGNCSDEYLYDSYAFDDRRGAVLQLQQTANNAPLGVTLVPEALEPRFEQAALHGSRAIRPSGGFFWQCACFA